MYVAKPQRHNAELLFSLDSTETPSICLFNITVMNTSIASLLEKICSLSIKVNSN